MKVSEDLLQATPVVELMEYGLSYRLVSMIEKRFKIIWVADLVKLHPHELLGSHLTRRKVEEIQNAVRRWMEDQVDGLPE